jgi:hypothetical protein
MHDALRILIQKVVEGYAEKKDLKNLHSVSCLAMSQTPNSLTEFI